ncbi:hypothetical protein E4U42_006119 [Claviceps africana]|uniref:DUF2423 domain-containing protein n=1 Tax=Claviceps africana TaxID=83212 RepID=A0A8K0NIZ7_9HYPO|nr:hypothetical protein E4U42_006119 [Claviceps africana]
MAKSARSSTRKQNNRRLYAKVFSPAEAARNERLSAKLLELAKQPKPESSDANMDGGLLPLFSGVPWNRAYYIRTCAKRAVVADDDAEAEIDDEQGAPDTAMDVDSKSSKPRSGKKTVDKRKQKKSGIVFKKYSDRVGAKKNKSMKR